MNHHKFNVNVDILKEIVNRRNFLKGQAGLGRNPEYQTELTLLIAEADRQIATQYTHLLTLLGERE